MKMALDPRMHRHRSFEELPRKVAELEYEWIELSSSLAAVGFYGIMTACVFAWEDRADKLGRYIRKTMQNYVDKYWTK